MLQVEINLLGHSFEMDGKWQVASNYLSAAMYNQTLPHGDEAMAETQEYHRNVAWT